MHVYLHSDTQSHCIKAIQGEGLTQLGSSDMLAAPLNFQMPWADEEMDEVEAEEKEESSRAFVRASLPETSSGQSFWGHETTHVRKTELLSPALPAVGCSCARTTRTRRR